MATQSGAGHAVRAAIEPLVLDEAAVTHAVQNGGEFQEVPRTNRGWSRREWDDAVAGLRERGDLDVGGVQQASASR